MIVTQTKLTRDERVFIILQLGNDTTNHFKLVSTIRSLTRCVIWFQFCIHCLARLPLCFRNKKPQTSKILVQDVDRSYYIQVRDCVTKQKRLPYQRVQYKKQITSTQQSDLNHTHP